MTIQLVASTAWISMPSSGDFPNMKQNSGHQENAEHQDTTKSGLYERNCRLAAAFDICPNVWALKLIDERELFSASGCSPKAR
jgi:hypothetical protein